jgi:DNA-directed RNA polymerase beta subunit
MVKNYKDLIANYFKDHSLVESNINSFNNFLDSELQKIIDEIGEIVPTIIPQEFENFKIKFNKIEIGRPEITEADGSRRMIYPMEARLRKLTYAAPIYLEVATYINDIQRELFTIQVGKMPIMLRSKYCHLNGLKKEQLVEKGEDPTDSGGYFILNGNERVLITVEDLASNKFFIKKVEVGPSKFVGKLFSERENYRIPHTFEQLKDGIITLTCGRLQRVPVIPLIKALGMAKDQEIMQNINYDKEMDDILVNLYDSVDLKNQKEAIEYLAKKIGIAQRDFFEERTYEQLDRYLLPHIGSTQKERNDKALNLCKLIKRFLFVSNKHAPLSDQDHYSNKKLKMSGDLLEDLFRVNLRALVQDTLYNFQRLVKRGKFTSVRIIIRDQLLSSRIKSAMATGTWPGGRAGISQNIARTNSIDTLSHLQRVVSLLTSTQENFDARALHSTHWGRLCPVETPEGTPIGLRKNLSLLSIISKKEDSDDKIKKILEDSSLKLV